MVEAFITDVLGWQKEDRGLFGHTNAYYGTVEQQGRLTLHLHLLLWIDNSLSPQEIRDRVMDPTSSFRHKLIRYLESCHQAEFINGSLMDIQQNVPLDLKAERKMHGTPAYIPPTHTLPECPPRLCKHSSCSGLCSLCRKFTEWWDKFTHETDDLLLRSNLHDHFYSIEDEQAAEQKKDWRGIKPKMKASKRIREKHGCLSKDNVCKARFPRTVIPSTVVSEDGHVSMRHIEPMMNTVNPILTYFSRCNTDVTSLLSGTSVKAVVSYVSDYVSKISLKSYQLFASVFQVFNTSSDMMRGDEKNHERSRHLMRKMVNSLSTKMEIGSPMAAMYVLGHPDHYSSHTYVPFPWKSYVTYVNTFWKADDVVVDDEQSPKEKVVISRQDGCIVAGSGVDDYIFRPVIFEHVTLYEWIQCADKKLMTKKERLAAAALKHNTEYSAALCCIPASGPETAIPVEDDGQDDTYFEADETDIADSDIYDVSDWDTEDEYEVIADKQARINKERRPLRHLFSKGHPKAGTHSVTCDFNCIQRVIPNFTGGALPRADKGDRNFYCMTMLTLFKPWRSPSDLKDYDSTWDQMFKSHQFTGRQNELMANFNVRYECNDARDDYYALMQKKLHEAKDAGATVHGHPRMGVRDKLSESMDPSLYDLVEQDDEDDADVVEYIGPKTLRLRKQAADIKGVLQNSGWLRARCFGESMPLIDLDRLLPPYKSRAEWSNIVKLERSKYTLNKLADLPPVATLARYNRTIWDDVEILDKDFLLGRSHEAVESAASFKSDIIERFRLNTEQARAFCIIADHAS
ncbi:hypothetical protein DFH09DRAFT_943410, partial [Mycena vulgaris]